MCEVRLSIPDETLVALKVSAEELGDELRLAAAVKLYPRYCLRARCGTAP